MTMMSMVIEVIMMMLIYDHDDSKDKDDTETITMMIMMKIMVKKMLMTRQWLQNDWDDRLAEKGKDEEEHVDND